MPPNEEPSLAPSLREVIASDHWTGEALRDLVTVVGSVDALIALDTTPHTQHTETVNAVGASTSAMANLVAATITGTQMNDALVATYQNLGCDAFYPFDAETRTIALRLLHRVARTNPHVLEATANASRVAAALMWVALRGSRMLNPRTQITASAIWDRYGVGDCTRLGQKLAVAAGCPGLSHDQFESSRQHRLIVGDAALLHSSYRDRLIRDRNSYELSYIEAIERANATKRVRMLSDGRVAITAEATKGAFAIKVVLETGALAVVIGLGESKTECIPYAMSITEARHLANLLSQALDAPFPDRGLTSQPTQ
jgi:hypothetical protein